ncbi:hypothetical protein AVEN_58658-1 [Araneus ventricosus]|uniref:Uncharacterized protein n=1 Tax=Araneus ventricosus TaxID=182803 RepID=A0A4Y2L567_ARAVE|nr:hypothetical protein AVEN_58658-1 [Araneus ventricosus]
MVGSLGMKAPGPRWPNGKDSNSRSEGSRFETRFHPRSTMYVTCTHVNVRRAYSLVPNPLSDTSPTSKVSCRRYVCTPPAVNVLHAVHTQGRITK